MRIEQIIRFSKDEVRAYRELLGLPASSDIVPGMMVNLAYGKLQIPWTYEAPVILRKLENELHNSIYIETEYLAKLEVIDVKKRRDQIHLVEYLTLHDSVNETCCFESRAKLVIGGVTYDE